MSRIWNVAKKLRSPRAAAQFIHERLVDRWIEWRLGITTEIHVRPPDFGLDPSYNSNLATQYTHLKVAFALLRPKRGDVLLDMGCGFGRVAIYAARFYPFKRVIGIDIVPGFIDTAQENLNASIKRLTCTDVDIRVGDATSYRVLDDVTVVYFFNPFSGEPLECALREIRDSLRRTPRTLRILSMTPRHTQYAATMRKQDWLRVERTQSPTEGPYGIECSITEPKFPERMVRIIVLINLPMAGSRVGLARAPGDAVVGFRLMALWMQPDLYRAFARGELPADGDHVRSEAGGIALVAGLGPLTGASDLALVHFVIFLRLLAKKGLR